MVRALLQTFPDVIQMRSTSCHTLLHFIPAMKINLVETIYFAEYISACRTAAESILSGPTSVLGEKRIDGYSNVDEVIANLVVDSLSRSCPHPFIQHFTTVSPSLPPSNDIQRINMYCLALVKPIPEGSILRDSTDTVSHSQHDDKGAKILNPRLSQMVTSIPLSGECMRELVKAYVLLDTPLFQREWLSGVNTESQSGIDLDSQLRRKFHGIAITSAFDVLPDHSRDRGNSSHKCMYSNDRIGSSQNRLKCTYALVMDDNKFVESSLGDDSIISKQVRLAKETEQHAYLVQYTLSSERPSRINSAMRSSFNVNEGSSIDNHALDRSLVGSSYHDIATMGALEADAYRHSHIHSEDEHAFRAVLLEEYGSSSGGEGLNASDVINSTGNVTEGDGVKRIWDPTILSTVCRWRSCLCECSDSSSQERSSQKNNYLCAYHSELKAFLDAQHAKDGSSSSASSESAKYLPRKAPLFNTASTGGGVDGTTAAAEDAKKDVITIRAASTLLQV